MDLAVSIGNTNIRLALRGQGTITTRQVPRGEWEHIPRLLQSAAAGGQVKNAAVASVDPSLTGPVVELLKPQISGGLHPLEMGPGFALDYSGYDAPRLGVDRALCCEAAAESVPPPLVVVDFGTATTLNAVDGERRFLGGMILPGVTLGLAALGGGTALLPGMRPLPDPPLIGRNTGECLSSGAVLGAALLVDAAFSEMAARLGEGARLIITGGNAAFIAPHLKTPFFHRKELIIEGIFLALDRLSAPG